MAVAGLFLIPTDRIAAVASHEVEMATGRKLVIEGGVRPTLWPQPGIRTGRVELANAPWSAEGPMVVSDGLRVGVDLGALWRGEVRLNQVLFETPRVLLERDAQGRVNWAFEPLRETAPGSGGGGRGFALDHGAITNGTLTFIDRAAGQRWVLSEVNADLRIPEFAGPARLSLKALRNGQPLTVTGEVGAFDSFLAGLVVPVRLDLGVDGTAFQFEGRAGTAPLALDGRIALSAPDPGRLFALLGRPAPDLPQAARGGLKLTGALTYASEGSLHLRDGQVVLGANQASAVIDLVPGRNRPRLNAQFTAGALDLSTLMAGQGDASGAEGWSTKVITADWLHAFDGEISVVADSVDLGQTKLGRTRLSMTVDNGRAVFDLREVQAYDGTITGQFVMNARSGLSVGGKLRAADVEMRNLLRNLIGYNNLAGRGQLDMEFLGVGNSMAAIMNSLSGKGALSASNGVLDGLDLPGALRSLSPTRSNAQTVFNRLGGSFEIRDGVLYNEDFQLFGPLVEARGRGVIGIGSRTLNYRLLPEAVVGRLRVPLLITGTWSDPQVRLDVQSVAEEQIEQEKKKLEDEAKEAVGKELGAQPGENLEDAVKRKLEEELNRGLRNLLQR